LTFLPSVLLSQEYSLSHQERVSFVLFIHLISSFVISLARVFYSLGLLRNPKEAAQPKFPDKTRLCVRRKEPSRNSKSRLSYVALAPAGSFYEMCDPAHLWREDGSRKFPAVARCV
jgi:hypothetical protein